MERSQHIPVYQGGAVTADDAVLAETGYDAPGSAYVARFGLPGFPRHQPGCGCCGARSPAASALSALFLARATGNAPFFRRVVVLASTAGWAEVEAALTQDVVTRARFRLYQEPNNRQ